MRFGWVLALWLCLASAATAASLDFTVPPPAVAAALPAGADVQGVSLTRAVISMSEGQPWLQQGGPLCLISNTQAWQASTNEINPGERLRPIFQNILTGAGFRVGGADPNDLFATSERAVDLQVGARITALRARACDMANYDARVATVVMDVEWQVFSVSQNRIVGRIPTTGGRKTTAASSTAFGTALDGAFAENVRSLAASESFRAIVATPAGLAPGARPAAAAEIRAAMPAPGAVSLGQAARSVVSIFTAEGHGSGVLISSEGYILTNHHVAGGSGRVRVRWPDGTDSVGEVLRGDGRRDVAVIKTEARAPALAIRPTPLQLGDTVFAIGTPLDKDLAGTLTRGVVSSFRTMEGQPFIQSDVAITHGNSGGPLLDDRGQVVGLAVSGRVENGVGVSLNFFIPIADAMKALSLKPAG